MAAQRVRHGCCDAGEAGNEKGYVVKMTDDTLATPYKIMPGTRVRLESAYDGTERRTGVMGCVRRAPLQRVQSLQVVRAMIPVCI